MTLSQGVKTSEPFNGGNGEASGVTDRMLSGVAGIYNGGREIPPKVNMKGFLQELKLHQTTGSNLCSDTNRDKKRVINYLLHNRQISAFPIETQNDERVTHSVHGQEQWDAVG